MRQYSVPETSLERTNDYVAHAQGHQAALIGWYFLTAFHGKAVRIFTSWWGRMERPSGALLEAGQVYRITLAKPERHNLPPIFAARFIENRARYDFHNGHFTGWQAIFEVSARDGSHRRSFGLPYESFSVESLGDLARNQIWY